MIIKQALGFEDYLSEVQEVFKEHKKLQKVISNYSKDIKAYSPINQLF